MQNDINLPVMGVTILLAAVLQDMIPVSLWLPVKIGFLTSVALFYMLTRPFLKALLALVWAGVLTDALGGLPALCTVSFLLCAYGAVNSLRSVIYSTGIFTGMVLCAGLSCMQMIWMRIWIGASGTVGIWYSFSLLGYSIVAGAIAGVVGFAICMLIDNLSGCIKPAKEKNGLSWSKAD